MGTGQVPQQKQMNPWISVTENNKSVFLAHVTHPLCVGWERRSAWPARTQANGAPTTWSLQTTVGQTESTVNHALTIKEGMRVTSAHISSQKLQEHTYTPDREMQSHHMARRRTKNIQGPVLTMLWFLLPSHLHLLTTISPFQNIFQRPSEWQSTLF